ncbi:uncharacterized protein TNCV_776051 [Trichonephila clavipes]|nr:uncharacterized protein TNCV_776051 [Trichonephila clavipes]
MLTLFIKPVQHKFQRNRVFVSDIDRQFQADLVDMQSLAEFNKGNTYPYRSYIETPFLNHGYDSKTSQLTAELFYKDSDDGLKKRTEFFKESATVDMIGCVYIRISSRSSFTQFSGFENKNWK